MSSQLSHMPERRHDVVVIGGGSAGYAAARTARDAGADVAIVDQGPLGGLCILRGCMPTKTILRSAEIIALMKRAREFGLSPVTAQADLSAIVARTDWFKSSPTTVSPHCETRASPCMSPAPSFSHPTNFVPEMFGFAAAHSSLPPGRVRLRWPFRGWTKPVI